MLVGEQSEEVRGPGVSRQSVFHIHLRAASPSKGKKSLDTKIVCISLLNTERPFSKGLGTSVFKDLKGFLKNI